MPDATEAGAFAAAVAELGPMVLARSTRRSLFSATFSPDGRQIVFARQSDRKGHRAIWVMNADGSSRHLVLNAHRFDSAVDWGPAG